MKVGLPAVGVQDERGVVLRQRVTQYIYVAPPRTCSTLQPVLPRFGIGGPTVDQPQGWNPTLQVLNDGIPNTITQSSRLVGRYASSLITFTPDNWSDGESTQ